MGNVVYSLIWLLIFIFISFFIAGICSFFYIILYPLTVCISGLKMGNICYSIIWFLIYILASYWIAVLCFSWYIIFIAFTVCIEALESVTDALLLGMQLPRTCVQNMIDGASLF